MTGPIRPGKPRTPRLVLARFESILRIPPATSRGRAQHYLIINDYTAINYIRNSDVRSWSAPRMTITSI